jgi:protein-disulfide isomerase
MVIASVALFVGYDLVRCVRRVYCWAPMHRPSSRSSFALLVGLQLALVACAKNPTPAPGTLTPASGTSGTAPAGEAPTPTTFTCAKAGAEVPADDTQRTCVPYAGEPKGEAQALITMVVFSDFQCPYCSRVLPTLDKLATAYPGKLRFYFRHMPLPFHKDARLAAQAAVAAENQGRFWAMHDLLFAHQRELERDKLAEYAKTIGLDLDRFQKDLDAPETRQRIAQDLGLARAMGVQGTPNFFINGRNVQGAVPVSEFKRVIDDELERAKKLGLQAASGHAFYAALMKESGKAGGKDGGKNAGKGPDTAEMAEAPPKIPVGSDVFNLQVGEIPQKGNRAAKVTLIAFMDFECPFSARAMKTLDALVARYKDDLRIAFRHFPLPFHKDAMNAALAATAAEQQGKFWEMAEWLFDNQQDLSPAALEEHAVVMGLDLSKYREAVADPKHRARAEEDMALGTRMGAAGTPAFFVNGHAFAGAYPLESFVTVIDDELGRANAVLATGVPANGLYAALTKDGLDKAPPKKDAARPGEPQPDQTYKVDIKGAPAKGAKNALVTIVEFADFQCPFCARVDETLAQLLKDYAGKVRVVWRNLPLSFHESAKRAAITALAAERQGKFWEMHDVLFKHTTELGDEALDRYAQELKLDMKKLKAAQKDDSLAKAIDDDAAAASKLGVHGTPAFFINGLFLSGAQPLERFKERIDEALLAANALVKKGTPKAKVYDAVMKNALPEVTKPAPAAKEDDAKAPQKVDVGSSPSRGPADAPVTLVVFSDFQCPFCARLEASLAEVEKAYPGKLRFVWKNFPLSFHAHAKASAEAAMAAHAQGKFWAMQGKLFENQNALEDGDLENYAREIGLDVPRFKADVASHKLAAAVEADLKQGNALGVEGTPATFVNGVMVAGALPPETFKALVDKELAKTAEKAK